MIVTSALIIWEGLMCVTGSESPVVVVLSGSMEPGFKRCTRSKMSPSFYRVANSLLDVESLSPSFCIEDHFQYFDADSATLSNNLKAYLVTEDLKLSFGHENYTSKESSMARSLW